ncbi:hypothetical protein GCM10009001_15850 [Virgibacillus siamensis]|uniref:RNA polymerase sigma-70 region 2 domain-containing protein n=1 Tax=Virgibacillus siamensis TaxID=480071 RepID=A0ABP3R5Y7_9BACI
MEEINHRIIRKVKKGNRKAFGQLIDFYKQNIYQICVSRIGNVSTAETIAKDVFLYVYFNIDGYDMNKKFSLWLYSITVNKIMNCSK